jgi:CheY-like chemotaxis protein
MIKRFLLADDDEDDIDLFEEALRNIDSTIELKAARNGKQLLEILKNGNTEPEIIFLDINMPEMNGWEALREIKNSGKFDDIPVVMYSTSSSKMESDKAVESGALAFYEKPSSFFDLKNFLGLIYVASVGDLRTTLLGIISSKKHKVYL